MNNNESISTKRLRIRLVRSVAKKLRAHKACVRGLGLRTLGQVAEVEDTPENRGMVNKVMYLLQVEELQR